MITINHPSVQTEGNAVTISYPILQDGHAPRTLSFTVDSRFRDFLNPGRADGALVALLPWISQQGGQVRVLPAISAHLYHFGIRLLSHILTGIGPFLKPVELAGEVHAEVLSPIPRDEKSRTFSSNSQRSHILRTSSRSRRLILSSIVSFAVWLKWTRTI